MATADISKQAVFDARVVQHGPRYQVTKGALSLTNSPYDAISATSSQHTYNINVPSQNVFVDRAIQWSSGVKIQFFVRCGAAAGAAPAANTQPILVFGRDVALCAFPLNSLVGTTTATINDTSVTINTDTVLREILRLTDYRQNRISRTCPTMLDSFKSYEAGYQSNNTPLADYLTQTDADSRPNGAWWDLAFIDPVTGNDLVGGTAAAPGTYVLSGTTVRYVSGVPVRNTAGQGGDPAGGYPLAIRFRSTEKLVLSPFVFAESKEWTTGLFGVNNMQIVLNMKADISRVLRFSSSAATNSGRELVAGTLQYLVSAGGQPFIAPRVNVQYLTPSLDLPLPAKSVVPYLEFPRYLTTLLGQTIGAGQTATAVPSQTIVLPQIPDMLLIYCKPQTYAATEGDWYLPITRISVNFDNFAGLLSSHTKEMLYEMSVHNGLDLDYDQWSGLAVSSKLGAASVPDGAAQPFKIQTVGGFLVLKPGRDITLQAGQAPGLIGNFTLQYNVDIFNPSDAAVTSPILYTVAVNSGFFETLAGSSRIVKGVLSEADIISAEPIPEMTDEGLARVVGGGFMDKIGSFLSKAKDIYTASKPALSAMKGALPEEGALGKVRGAMSAVGYGAGPAGGARAGGASHKSLSARLM